MHKKALKILAWQGFAVALGIGIVLHHWLPEQISRQPVLLSLLNWVPYLVLALVGVLGLKLNQLRIFYGAVFAMASFAWLSVRQEGPFLPWHSRLEILALAWPVMAIAMAFLRPARLLSRMSAFHLAAGLTPALGLALWHHSSEGNFESFAFWPGVVSSAIHLGEVPDLAWPLAMIGAASAFALKDRTIRGFQLSLALAVVPLDFLLGVGGSSMGKGWASISVPLLFTIQSLGLAYAVYRIYWSKVYIDELTGIPNRRALNEKFMTLDRHYSVAMMDIDHFKKFNDTYGHDQGDWVLQQVAAHLDQCTGGRVYRYGGEEFCVILENEEPSDVERLLDETRGALAARRHILPNAKKDEVRITISIGIASRNNRLPTAEEVRLEADHLLYAAKEAGRNCVVTSAGPRKRLEAAAHEPEKAKAKIKRTRRHAKAA